MENAKWVTEISHNHPEGTKGAQATASLNLLAVCRQTNLNFLD